MALKDSKYGRLVLNTGLAFIAGAVTAFGTLVATTPKADTKAFIIAVAGGALFAGFRAAAGFLALNAPKVPAIPTDTP